MWFFHMSLTKIALLLYFWSETPNWAKVTWRFSARFLENRMSVKGLTYFPFWKLVTSDIITLWSIKTKINFTFSILQKKYCNSKNHITPGKVIIGSKTAVMDIIGFLNVSLCSSTVQLHDNLGGRHACTSSVVKTVSTLQQRITEDQHPVVHFLWTKELNAKDSHKEMFPVYVGKCLLHKVVPPCLVNVSVMTRRLKQRRRSDWDNS
jgi:hypothetical protein